MKKIILMTFLFLSHPCLAADLIWQDLSKIEQHEVLNELEYLNDTELPAETYVVNFSQN